MAGPAETAETGELDRLAEDWIALWQSELAGMATDPALAEAWSATLTMQHALAMAALGVFTAPPPHERTAPSPRPATAAAAPDVAGAAGLGGAGDDAARLVAPLVARIAELEQRLARLEAGPGGGGTDRRRPRRQPGPA